MLTKKNFNQFLSDHNIPHEQLATWEVLASIETNLAEARAALFILAKHPDEGVRAVVAQDFNCPLEALLLLAKDVSKEVRRHVASNPSASFSVLNTLVKDPEADVSMVAKQSRQWLMRLGYSPWTHVYPPTTPPSDATTFDADPDKTLVKTTLLSNSDQVFF